MEGRVQTTQVHHPTILVLLNYEYLFVNKTVCNLLERQLYPKDEFHLKYEQLPQRLSSFQGLSAEMNHRRPIVYLNKYKHNK